MGLQWRNMGSYVGENAALNPWLDSSSFLWVFRIFLFTAAGLIITFCVTKNLWQAAAARFRLGAYLGLSEMARLIFCCHTVFVLLLAEQIVPYSIYAVRVLYGEFLLEMGSLYKPCAQLPAALHIYDRRRQR